MTSPTPEFAESSEQLVSTRIARPQRWDQPFSSDMTDAIIDRIFTFAPFSEIDQKKFPTNATLRDILRNDARLMTYKAGDIVVREGDYGQSAFFVLEGSVAVTLQNLPSHLLGRTEAKKKTFWEALSQLWKNTKVAEQRDLSRYASDKQIGAREEKGGEVRIFLQDFSTILKNSTAATLKQGEWFGEIAALGRTPRTATVIAHDKAVLLEIRWQGLRDIRLRSESVKKHIDQLYRERSLATHLSETDLFQHLPPETIEEIGKRTIFETHGNFEWFAEYQRKTGESAAQRVESEPLIAREGDYPNGLILIRSGFARLSEQYGHGHQTISFLGKGQVYGLKELVHNWRTNSQISLQHSLRAVGYVDVLIVPTAVIEKFVLPTIPAEKLPAPIVSEKQVTEEKTPKVSTHLLEFLVENRFVNGTATMIIDLDRCTRCDDCVRACASAHDDNPRFLRHGKISEHYMIANACMHCADPVCMIGCPTGAIHRNEVGGQVLINDQTCIGCSTCANSCPYDNIRMVEIRDDKGLFVRDEHTHTPILKATKCDLCSEQLTGPACQNACPHDALKRVDMKDVEALGKWLNR